MEYKLSTLHLLLIAQIFLPISILGSNNCKFPAIFNFGDSNSDTGGFSAAFVPTPPPNGETFFHAPAGRYSDGRLIIDFIAESLGLPYLSAFLDSVGSNFSHGANFATYASTIRPQNLSFSKGGYSPISLDVQHVEYSGFLARSQIARKQGCFQSLLPEKDYFSRALYTFDIGQNDLTAGLDLSLTTEEVKAQVPDMLGQFSNIIKLLYSQGGRSFLIHNTGPVGCLPYVMDRFLVTAAQIDKHGCSSPYNEVSQYFNLELKEMVLQLRRELPLAAITYVDVYSVKYSLISQAKKLGFENPFLACCGHGGKYNYNRFIKCGSRKVLNGTETVLADSCKDPSVRISWDGTHFTEAANRWIFDQIVDGSYSDPPLPLKFACNK
ncbi:GDSL-like Lipase/Acylhydrolase superfamily protein [Perilla frutescens var. hirtella]|nr:GDSL-like Lipase/Acylhydrolase superfamily protein [Perilla frutescens var. hirtella]KAH6805171.1 GDSL-like Lipase/Acylhydrolase superfamily protein [Perilla frutescens var. frutescens]